MTHYLIFFFLIHLIILFVLSLSVEKKCNTCLGITKQFKEGLQRTEKSNFGGGNTHWEDKNLGTYAFSETRFLEILEGVCNPKSEKECHHMLEENEEFIESWWFDHYAKGVATDLKEMLCVRRLQACCPDGTYGENCEKCDGGKNVCSSHGTCMGDGTRGGSGKCQCWEGYESEICDECSLSYFKDIASSNELVCLPCHKSCKDGCSGMGSLKCTNCKEGWVQTPNQGCIDLNECQDETMCTDRQFCLNTDGSYKCISCHKSCGSCKNETENDCLICAANYFQSGHLCLACHESCAKSCKDETALTCDACKKGWNFTETVGCQDVDECKTKNQNCALDEYCINTIGSYKCSTCHHSCEECIGAGNAHCRKCRHGYIPDEKGVCLLSPDHKPKNINNLSSKKGTTSSKKNAKTKKESWREEFIQYFASLFVFVASCLFVKNSLIAQLLIATVFAIYLYYFTFHIDKSYRRKS